MTANLHARSADIDGNVVVRAAVLCCTEPGDLRGQRIARWPTNARLCRRAVKLYAGLNSNAGKSSIAKKGRFMKC